ncbi:hypothetical protein XAP412_1310028 [Xanthomonas phaseoli pv. phaseoli]|uniref:Uncharacterized protein n=1 Tax=Xanthomonas campestris pv. phaseoli TaxID=317013 RepID=A0AB38DXG2_XANCH|nr:hypothetical protein XAP6984_1330033 [Xanthomonas phaseoli pv. phaseoli]SON79833.1 hypothetical protein XAP412_1310028 [Xanthomonas phaseoli pv. phaseoli]SON82954.1 hypothetical protein XAP7430_1310034 [Xanthomonas phaseoli pv. phaseoli]
MIRVADRITGRDGCIAAHRQYTPLPQLACIGPTTQRMAIDIRGISTKTLQEHRDLHPAADRQLQACLGDATAAR